MNPTQAPKSPPPVRRLFLSFALLSGLCAGAFSASAVTTEVFRDDFEDGNRGGWYTSAASSGLGVNRTDDHKLDGYALRAINTIAVGMTHFPTATLGVGESLTISFNISHANAENRAGGLVFGVFNSFGGPTVGADVFAGNADANPPVPATDFSAYQGYRVFTNPGASAASGTTIGKRNANQSSIVDGTYTALTDGIGNGVGLISNTAYSVSITFARTGESSLETTFSLNGVTITGTDNDASNFAFNTFAYKKSNSTGNSGNLYLDDFLVTHTAVPEPASAGVLTGVIIGLMVFCGRRRRRSHS